ncbi:hypothetical protein HY638_04790 [Candidatus Woesearchaeota archaeon]|nr:hypothetical protein [Candidatus Woesearchaeota archaeon]
MESTLIGQLKVIEDVPDYIRVDKIVEIRELFDEWRERNKTVDRVVKGETSFSEQVEEAAKRFQGVKNYLPIPDDSYGDADELSDVLGYVPRKSTINSLCTPIPTAAIGATGFGSFLSSLGFINLFIEYGGKRVSRRELFKQVKYMSLTGVLGGAGLGSMAGFGLSQANLVFLDRARENALYLDSKVQQLYRS